MALPFIPPPTILRVVEELGEGESQPRVWELGKPFVEAPAPWMPNGERLPGDVTDCVVSAIFFFSPPDGEAFYEIIGMPAQNGNYAKHNMGVITEVPESRVMRCDKIQRSDMLDAYIKSETSARIENARKGYEEENSPPPPPAANGSGAQPPVTG